MNCQKMTSKINKTLHKLTKLKIKNWKMIKKYENKIKNDLNRKKSIKTYKIDQINKNLQKLTKISKNWQNMNEINLNRQKTTNIDKMQRKSW